ncbi:MAG: GbsR/MarR family transcriptional regulator [Halodesulfurarchaeum sp.]
MNDTTDDRDEIDDPVERAREEVIVAFERTAELYGLSRSYGRLYGILYFKDEPVSLDDLVDESGYAKSTVSTAMKKMETLHVVQRRSLPGEGKRIFYEAETDFWQIFQSFLEHEVKREIDIMSRALDSAAETLSGIDDERAERDLQKIRSLRTLYDRSEQLVDVLTSTPLKRITEAIHSIRKD